MGPKLLRGDIELCRKLNLSKLLGNTNSSSACPKSHWNFCPGAAQLEQDPPGQVPLPSLARIWRKTETPKSKKAIELRCDRRFLRHPFPTPQELSPSGVGAERGSQGIPGVLVLHPEFPAPYTAQDSHPTHLSHKPLPPVPWNCKQGIMCNFFAGASCRREWS